MKKNTTVIELVSQYVGHMANEDYLTYSHYYPEDNGIFITEYTLSLRQGSRTKKFKFHVSKEETDIRSPRFCKELTYVGCNYQLIPTMETVAIQFEWKDNAYDRFVQNVVLKNTDYIDASPHHKVWCAADFASHVWAITSIGDLTRVKR